MKKVSRCALGTKGKKQRTRAQFVLKGGVPLKLEANLIKSPNLTFLPAFNGLFLVDLKTPTSFLIDNISDIYVTTVIKLFL